MDWCASGRSRMTKVVITTATHIFFPFLCKQQPLPNNHQTWQQWHQNLSISSSPLVMPLPSGYHQKLTVFGPSFYPKIKPTSRINNDSCVCRPNKTIINTTNKIRCIAIVIMLPLPDKSHWDQQWQPTPETKTMCKNCNNKMTKGVCLFCLLVHQSHIQVCWHTWKPLPHTIVALCIIGNDENTKNEMPAVIFTSYIL